MVSSSHLLQGSSPLSPCALWLILPGASERAPQHRRRGEGCSLGGQSPSVPPPTVHPSPVEAAQSPTGLRTQRRCGEALPRACLWAVCTRGCHTWGPTPGWPAPGGLPRGPGTGARARAVFPSSHLMPARYLSSPGISLSSKNRKGTG